MAGHTGSVRPIEKKMAGTSPAIGNAEGDKDERCADPDQAGALSFTGTPLSLNSDCNSPA
jgi:hypothetical protein